MSSTLLPELDPLFLKAISLLHSKHPDSTKQLKDLVDDYKEKTYGIKKAPIAKIIPQKCPSAKISSIKPSSSELAETTTTISEQVITTVNTNEITNYSAQLQELPFSTVDQSVVEEVTFSSSFTTPSKKAKLHSSTSASTDMSPPPALDMNEQISLDEIIGMDFDGPICKVCHLGGSDNEDNSIVDCCECHHSYHQLCHKPPVPTKDVEDPRLIWYCSSCTKKMKKELAQQSQPLTKTKTLMESAKANPFQQNLPFRRNLPEPTTKNESSEVSKKSKPRDQTAAKRLVEPPAKKRNKIKPKVQ